VVSVSCSRLPEIPKLKKCLLDKRGPKRGFEVEGIESYWEKLKLQCRKNLI